MLNKDIVVVALVAACLMPGNAGDPGTSIIKVQGVGDVLSNIQSDGTVEALGIPFAAPPVGQNRFRSPQPPKYSGSTLNATAYGDACLQHSMTGDVGGMSEDCLTLNIWSPASQGRELLPVFFWIHGGGFVEGSGKLYNGSHLANLGIVVVTINYRLATFGWFASDEIAKENPQAPGTGGTNGFLDQVRALHWVREHIAAFGGDAKQITIGGESAGSLSTCVHLHLPVSKDLYRRAIMESGSCVAGAPWIAGWNATVGKTASAGLAASVNATDLASLRKVSADTIWKSPAFAAVNPSPDGWYMKHTTAELPVLTKGVDIIVGANTMDSLNTPPYLGTIPQIPDFTPKNSSEFNRRLKDYFGDEIFSIYNLLPSDTSADEVSTVFFGISGDVCNTCPKHWAAEKFLAAEENVFVYEFGFSSYPMKGLACHGCEISDVFNMSINVGGAEAERIMRASYTPQLGDSMSTYWANFIKSGQPQGHPAWPKYEGNIRTAKQLHIATTSTGEPHIGLDGGLDAMKCEFFDKFVKTSSSNNQKYANFCNFPMPLSSEPAAVLV